MRRITVWGAGLLAALAALAPGRAGAQPLGLGGGIGSGDIPAPDYAPPANANLPLPLYSTNPEQGPYFAGGFALYQTSNPIKDQIVGVRGFIVTTPVAPALNGTFINFNVAQGTFLGNRTAALDTHQVSGPSTYQPGFTVEGGWKFLDGSTLTVSWMWLAEAQYRATATLINRPDQVFGAFQENSFLTAFVFNFPPQYSGPAAKVTVTPVGQTTGAIATTGVYGIWNGASVMTESFVQRIEELKALYRVPFYETECYRVSGLVGPRFFWFWERYRWTTTDVGLDAAGNAVPDQPDFSATYNNIVSNRLYGVDVGFSQEYYIGKGFACMFDTRAALFLDVVREKVNYQLGSKELAPQNKRARTQYYIVPEVQATPRIMWYPWEGIQMALSCDGMAFFNTISSPRPVSFNYSGLDPNWERTFRWLDGFQATIAFVF
jgi:hypothetical protein